MAPSKPSAATLAKPCWIPSRVADPDALMARASHHAASYPSAAYWSGSALNLAWKFLMNSAALPWLCAGEKSVG